MGALRGIVDELRRAPLWERIVAGLMILLATALSCWAIERLVRYWTRDVSYYYNPNYAIGDNVEAIQIHATFGFICFLLVPTWLATSWYLPESKPAMFTVSIISVVCLIITAGTVSLIKKTVIRQESGVTAVAVALLWALWWFVCGVGAGVQWLRGRNGGVWGSWAWWMRYMAMAAFGYAVLPIFFHLKNDILANSIVFPVLLLAFDLLSEWIVRRGVNQVKIDGMVV